MNEEQRRRILALSPTQRALFDAALRACGLAEEAAPPAREARSRDEDLPQSGAEPADRRVEPCGDAAGPALSLFFFSDDGASDARDKYGLVLAAAERAEALGFASVWIPERHFHPFGGLYPNPAVLAAAIAARTRRIGIRAGSVVLPLHHPVRVAEEWAMLDNLSGGRAGVSLASGWVPEDFVLSGAPFEERRAVLRDRLDTVRRLWRGEAVAFPVPGRTDPVSIRTFPRPLRGELPLWLTTSGTRETWVEAGHLGLHVLTGLLRLSLEDVAGHAACYREARRAAGHDPAAGRVTLMLHTFVGRDERAVEERVREPLLDYLRTHLSLYEMQVLARERLGVDPSRVSADDREALAEFAYRRYLRESGLFGTPDTCRRTLARLRAHGIDEVGCLIDFGVERGAVLEGLPLLAEAGGLTGA